jgi:Tfp pilus assembly protein PilP
MKPSLSSLALLKPTAAVALTLSVLVLGACGESSEEKAKAQVCDARADISKQVDTLTSLTITTASVAQVKTGVEAIVADVKKIKDEQSKLDPARKEEVQSANEAFAAEVTKIVSGIASDLSISNAEAHLKTAVSQLAAGYKKTLAPISCS